MSSSVRTVEALFLEGTRLMREGRLHDASDRFESALALDPEVSEVHANLGLVLDGLRQDVRAEAHFERALALRPHLPEAMLNWAALQLRQKRLDEAQTLLERALTLRPHDAATWTNLGLVHACRGQDWQAEACHQRALSLDPDMGSAAYNLAYVLLRQGRWSEGWPALEHRPSVRPLEAYFSDVPRWRGEPLNGRSILLAFEAGHGDMIQCLRHVAAVSACGAGSITLVVHPALKRLCLTALRPSVDAVLAFDEPITHTGWATWSPLMSLPGLFDVRPPDALWPGPYLEAPADGCDWALQMLANAVPRGADGPPLRIGLVWRGTPLFENDEDRSLPSLAALVPLASTLARRVPGHLIQWVSLQKGKGEQEALVPPEEFAQSWCNAAASCNDFADTAAVISRLDAVVAVDTAVAHLAGALGIPCLLLLPAYKTDWRWLIDRDDTPWYPQTRLYRQPKGQTWAQALAIDAEHLATLLTDAQSDIPKIRSLARTPSDP